VLLVALIPLAAIAVYWNSLGGDFVWDDRFLIVDNPRVQSFDRIGELLTHDYVFIAETDLAYGYFRPLSSLSLAVDYAVWGPDPKGFHLTNLLLHVASTLLAGYLALRLGATRGVAWATSLLFAVHPIHTESVSWIAGRTDPLAFLFAGGSFALFLVGEDRQGTPRRYFFGGSVLLFGLGLLAKEMAAVVPLWIAACRFWSPGEGSVSRRLRRSAVAAWPWLLVVAGYAVVRFGLLAVAPPEAPAEHTLLRALASAPTTVVRYLGWMAFPADLSAYIQNPYVTRLGDPRLLASLIVLAILAGILARIARARPEVGRLATLLAFSFAPILNFVRIAGPPDMGALMAERFLYLPSFAFLLLAVTLGEIALERLFRSAGRRRIAAAASLLVVTALWARQTVERNRDWSDDVTFFERESARTPGAPLLWTNLAQAEMRAGRPAESERAIRRAEQLTPEAPWVLAVRAQWLTLAGRYAEALPIQRRVVSLERKGNALATNNLAFLERSTGKTREALAHLSELVARLPSYPDPWLNLAEIERLEGDRASAVASYRRYLDLRPRDLRAVESLAGIYAAERRFDEAEELYRAALRGDALDARIWNNVATLRLARGTTPALGALDALEAIDRALAIEPSSPRARFNRAKLLGLTGRDAEGRAILEVLVREAPASEVGVAAAGALAADAARPDASTGELGENLRP
jgi:tetratricopeptide (TPR) repeat protein